MTRGKFFLFLFVLGVIVVLFCIPEFVQYQNADRKKSSTVVVSRSESPGAGEGEMADIEAPNELDKFAAFLDAPRGSLRSGSSAPGEGGGQKSDGAPITWEKLRKGKNREAIDRSRKAALELARSVPLAYSGTRYSLFNYANGVAFVLGKGGDSLPPKEGQGYLLALDKSVVNAMYRETLDRDFQQRWKEISVSPLISGVEGTGPGFLPFTPQIKVTAVTFRQRHRRDGSIAYPIAAKVRFSGTVIGNDVYRAEILSYDGASFQRRRLKLTKTDTAYNLFITPMLDGTRSWTVKVYDKYGQSQEKSYYFFDQAQRFEFDRNVAQFPFHMEEATPAKFMPHDVDPRVDTFFQLSYGDNDAGFGSGADFERF